MRHEPSDVTEFSIASERLNRFAVGVVDLPFAGSVLG